MGDSLSSPKKQEKRSPKAKADAWNSKWNTGRWTKEEHTKFLEAIKIHGRDWKKVQDYVVTRTSTQARSHAQKVLPHPSGTEGINQSHNSTSTTLTKGSPQSQKNFPNPEWKKAMSQGSDADSCEFAIFKVEKIRKPMIGRDRVNSENNVFNIPVDNYDFSNMHENKARNWTRKYSVNVEFNYPQNDLTASPIKECIKEHISEDEEEDAMEEIPHLHIDRNKTWGSKLLDSYNINPLFWFENKGNDLNLEVFDDPARNLDFPMDVEDGPAALNSLVNNNDFCQKSLNDRSMQPDDDLAFNMDVEVEDNFH